MRAGIGEDSHAFEKGKILVLGGVKISDCDGLRANSDGDVVLHALCNALGSAIGEGSLSNYADEMCRKGMKDSKEYVRKVMDIVTEADYIVKNVSISIEAKKPKIEPLRIEIKDSIAKLLKINKEDVGITATTGEGLSAFGKGLGIRCTAIATLRRA